MPKSAPGHRKLPEAERRKQILLASIEVIAMSGVNQTTIPKVADLAGVSTGLIHLHFSVKDRLIAETADYLLLEHRRHWDETLSSDLLSSAEKLYKLLSVSLAPHLCAEHQIYAFRALFADGVVYSQLGAKVNDYRLTRISVFLDLVSLLHRSSEVTDAQKKVEVSLLESFYSGVLWAQPFRDDPDTLSNCTLQLKQLLHLLHPGHYPSQLVKDNAT